jgi:hypothetical protein
LKKGSGHAIRGKNAATISPSKKESGLKSSSSTTLIEVCLVTLFAGTLIAQTPQGSQNGPFLPRQPQPAPTQKEVAVMKAALKYYLEPDAVLYPTHDPEIVKQDDTYYLFPTGGSVSSSTDLIVEAARRWQKAMLTGPA